MSSIETWSMERCGETENDTEVKYKNSEMSGDTLQSRHDRFRGLSEVVLVFI